MKLAKCVYCVTLLLLYKCAAQQNFSCDNCDLESLSCLGCAGYTCNNSGACFAPAICSKQSSSAPICIIQDKDKCSASQRPSGCDCFSNDQCISGECFKAAPSVDGVCVSCIVGAPFCMCDNELLCEVTSSCIDDRYCSASGLATPSPPTRNDTPTDSLDTTLLAIVLIGVLAVLCVIALVVLAIYYSSDRRSSGKRDRERESLNYSVESSTAGKRNSAEAPSNMKALRREASLRQKGEGRTSRDHVQYINVNNSNPSSSPSKHRGERKYHRKPAETAPPAWNNRPPDVPQFVQPPPLPQTMSFMPAANNGTFESLTKYLTSAPMEDVEDLPLPNPPRSGRASYRKSGKRSRSYSRERLRNSAGGRLSGGFLMPIAAPAESLHSSFRFDESDLPPERPRSLSIHDVLDVNNFDQFAEEIIKNPLAVDDQSTLIESQKHDDTAIYSKVEMESQNSGDGTVVKVEECATSNSVSENTGSLPSVVDPPSAAVTGDDISEDSAPTPPPPDEQQDEKAPDDNFPLESYRTDNPPPPPEESWRSEYAK